MECDFTGSGWVTGAITGLKLLLPGRKERMKN
jgi:hypothetical protein